MLIPMNTQLQQASTDYDRIEQALRFLEEHFAEQPDLATVAGHVGLSLFHFQRLFKRWAGVTPKQFLQSVTAAHARQLLAESRSVLETSYEVGLSGPGRLHDLLVTLEAVTPGEYKRGGAGLDIGYGFHPTPFGYCLLAVTGRGICGLHFVEGDEEAALARLRGDYPRAALHRADAETGPFATEIFAAPPPGRRFHLYLRGTNFQIQVWRALLDLPTGTLAGYQDIARRIGRPTASRAVAGAIGRNPVGFLIPCHRVISQTAPCMATAGARRARRRWWAGSRSGRPELKTRLPKVTIKGERPP